jgi:crotonobetainyl-CoA:carnitine CoA-transferase CaiB-like acyl-CoA transferase
MSSAADRPFEGLTVVEFGQFVVVPFASQFLADGGARVIKVEPPSGDTYRSADPIAPNESRSFITKNRGKESLVLRLGEPAARTVIERLVRTADVVLVNMRRQTVEKRGLTYDDIKALNPRVVYGSVTAFGKRGPEAEYAGMDVVAQARGGLMQALGSERDGIGFHSEVQVADYTAALLLLSGITTALFARERLGVGQEVEVSLLGGALTVQNNVFGEFADHDGWRDVFLDEVLPRARAERWDASRLEQTRSRLRPDPRNTDFYRVFRTADGTLAIGAGSPDLVRLLIKALDVDPDAPRDRQAAGVEGALAALPSAEAMSLMHSVGIPVSHVLHVEELLRDAHVEAEGLVQDLEHPTAGPYRALGNPIRLSETPFAPTRSSPAFGEHTLQILSELGFSPVEIGSLIDAGAAVGASAPEPVP